MIVRNSNAIEPQSNVVTNHYYARKLIPQSYFERQNSFKAIGTGSLGRSAIGFFEKMNNSLAVNFLVLDALGLVAPRVVQAYYRNSKEIGHKNTAAAIEEFTREALTGPSIVLLPVAVSLGLARWAGKSIELPKHLLDEFHSVVKTIAGDKDFTESFKMTTDKLKSTQGDVFETIQYRKEIQEKVVNKFFSVLLDRSIPKEFPGRSDLINKLTNEFKTFETKDVAERISKIISTHNKLYETFPERPFHMYFSMETQKTSNRPYGRADTWVKSTKKYIKDVVKKISPFIDHPHVTKMIDNLQAKIMTGKIISAVGGIVAVAIALRLIPIWYSSLHQSFPGIYGLTDVPEMEEKKLRKPGHKHSKNVWAGRDRKQEGDHGK